MTGQLRQTPSTTDFTSVSSVSVSGASTTTATVTGRTNGTQYYFRVIATSAGHQGAASAQASATPQAPPSAPTNLRLTAGNAQVEASWMGVTNATGYTVYYSTSSLASTTNFDGVSKVDAAGASTTVPVTGLTNGTLYYFRVVATNAGGASAASIQASTTPGAAGTVFRDTLSGGGQGPQMVALSTGTFIMGSPSTEEGRFANEGPTRTVTINKRIAMGRYEVTFDDYKRFTDDPATTQTLPADGGWGRGTRPVINVSWNDANAYARWLSTQTGKPYRLPTEAEWEYAARAGETAAYSFGTTISCSQANYGRSAIVVGNERPCNNPTSITPDSNLARTVAVGSFSANAFGLYDMHGNVWEWVQDCYINNYNNAPTDGRARTSRCTVADRVVRGGAWSRIPRLVRSASREWWSPTSFDNRFGFRLVQDLNP